MHAFSSYCGNRPSHTKKTNKQDRLQYTAPQLARSVIKGAVGPWWIYVLYCVSVYFNIFLVSLQYFVNYYIYFYFRLIC